MQPWLLSGCLPKLIVIAYPGLKWTWRLSIGALGNGRLTGAQGGLRNSAIGCRSLADAHRRLQGRMLGNCRLPDAYGSTWAIENHIHDSLNGPGEQEINDHGDDG